MGQAAEDLEDWEIRQQLGGSYDATSNRKGKQMADETQNSGALAKWAGGGGDIATREEAAKALLESAEAGGSGGGDGVEYLTFSGQGSNFKGWSIGRDKRKPDPDMVVIIDPMSAIEGWVCWKGGSPVEKHEWSVFERKVHAVPQSQLRDHGPYSDDNDGWKFQMGLSMFDIDDPTQQIKFSTTTKSAKNVLADLNTEIAKRLLNDEPEVPVSMLSAETFTSKGKPNGKPVFAIEGWVTRAEVERFLQMGDDGDLDDLLAGKYVAAEPVADEPTEADPPKRRTRRKAA